MSSLRLAVAIGVAAAAFAAAPAAAQPGTAGSAAIGYSGSISDQTAIGFLTSAGTLTPVTSPLMNQSTSTPTVLESSNGYLTIFEQGNGPIRTAKLSPNGTLGPTRTLQGTSSPPLGAATPSNAALAAGQLVLTGISGPASASTSQLIVARFAPNGNLVSQRSVTIRNVDPDSAFPAGVVGTFANPDGSVWVATSEGSSLDSEDGAVSGLTLRLFTSRGVRVTRRVVGPEANLAVNGIDVAGDSAGGIFVLADVYQTIFGPPTPEVLRAIHVDEGGDFENRVASRSQNVVGGEILSLGSRARIIYHSYSNSGRGGIFTRRFSAAGALSRRRTLARSGSVQETTRIPGGVGVRILRRRRGVLRLHRLPRRGRLARGKIVVGGGAVTGALAYDDARRAYIAWTVANNSRACVAATQDNLQDVYARVIGLTSRPVRLVSACADAAPPVAQ